MIFKFHIPTQTYGFLEIEGDLKEIEEAEVLYNRYAEKPIQFKEEEGVFVELYTFTDEKVRYNDATHKYTDIHGNPLVSGSQYKKSLEKPFPLEMMASKISEKYGVPANIVTDMWKGNSTISTTFGTALHLAMEQWFRFKGNACDDKEYNVAKHPFLRQAVTSFPLKDAEAYPEVLVSDVENGMVGRIDLLTKIDGKYFVEDYKSDADIKKNLNGHFAQLSFYAQILKNKGFDIDGVRVWNYAGDGWENYTSEVLPINKEVIY